MGDSGMSSSVLSMDEGGWSSVDNMLGMMTHFLTSWRTTFFFELRSLCCIPMLELQ
jgi:hypothetical protein